MDVCVCCVCCDQDLSTSQEEEGPCPPLLAHSYLGNGTQGSLLPSPPAPAAGASLAGDSLLQERGWLCVREGCASILSAGPVGGGWWEGPPTS